MLTGLRRIGKTTLLKGIIQQLLSRNILPTRILFLSLDILYFTPYSIQDIIIAYKKLHRIEHQEHVYLILDEVTYKPHFNQELKNLYDKGTYKIFASSSSASTLKDNKAFLTGRARYITINPLNFEEFLVCQNKFAEC
ncbi:MAG: ATP-binding protein [Candidatus Woesearchaeota archaeon]